MKNNNEFIDINDVNMQICNVVSPLNNKNYKMILNVRKDKTGNEQFILYNGHNPNNEKMVLSKDLLKEKRKNGNNVIGTSIVNIINYLPDLLNILNYYKLVIEKKYIQDITSFYEELVKMINGLKEENISNIDNCINQIMDFRIKIYTKNNNMSDEDILKLLLTLNCDEDTSVLCHYIINSLNLNKRYPIINFLHFSTLIDDFNSLYKTNNVSINEIISLHTNEILENIFKAMFSKIVDILQDNHFIITTFITNFCYLFHTIFYMDNIFGIFKNDLQTKALYTDTNNTYYKNLYNYLKNKKNVNAPEDKVNICIIFIESLYTQLIYLQKLIEKSDNVVIEQQIELPKSTTIFSDNDTDRILKACQYSYQINSIKDFINVSLYHIVLDNRKILKCHNCNRYFVSDVRNNEIYCRRVDPNDPHHRTCDVIAVAKRSYIYSDDERLKKYKNIYARLKNKKYDKEKELEIFVEKYKEYKTQLPEKFKKAAYDRDFKNQKLLDWLIKYDNKLQKKYPSRYDFKKAHRT